MGGKLTFDSEREHQVPFGANFARKLVQCELLVVVVVLELLGKQKLGEVKSPTAARRSRLVLLEVMDDIWASLLHLGAVALAHASVKILVLFHLILKLY